MNEADVEVRIADQLAEALRDREKMHLVKVFGTVGPEEIRQLYGVRYLGIVYEYYEV